MKYTLWNLEGKWYWDLVDEHATQLTDMVGPYDTEVQAMVSMMVYATKVDL